MQTLGLDDLPQSLLRSLLSCHLWVYKFILSILLWPLVKSSFLWLQVGKEDVENRAQCSFLEDKPLISSVHSPFLLFVFLTYATTFPSIWGLPSPHFMQYSGTISSLCLSCPPPRLALSRPPPQYSGRVAGAFPSCGHGRLDMVPFSIHQYSQLQSNRRLSLCPEGRMSVFIMLPATCQPRERRLEGGRLNLMRIVIAVTQSLP